MKNIPETFGIVAGPDSSYSSFIVHKSLLELEGLERCEFIEDIRQNDKRKFVLVTEVTYDNLTCIFQEARVISVPMSVAKKNNSFLKEMRRYVPTEAESSIIGMNRIHGIPHRA